MAGRVFIKDIFSAFGRSGNFLGEIRDGFGTHIRLCGAWRNPRIGIVHTSALAALITAGRIAAPFNAAVAVVIGASLNSLAVALFFAIFTGVRAHGRAVAVFAFLVIITIGDEPLLAAISVAICAGFIGGFTLTDRIAFTYIGAGRGAVAIIAFGTCIFPF